MLLRDVKIDADVMADEGSVGSVEMPTSVVVASPRRLTDANTSGFALQYVLVITSPIPPSMTSVSASRGCDASTACSNVLKLQQVVFPLEKQLKVSRTSYSVSEKLNVRYLLYLLLFAVHIQKLAHVRFTCLYYEVNTQHLIELCRKWSASSSRSMCNDDRRDINISS